jgi:hypothetical protein
MRPTDSETRVQLTKKEPFEASKTLGVHASPFGDQEGPGRVPLQLGIEFVHSNLSEGGTEPNNAW